MSTMKRNMFIISILSAVLSVLFYAAYTVYGISLFYPLLITSLTIFYHFTARLIIGYLLHPLRHHDFVCNSGIFKEHGFEKKLYKQLKVKSWKDKMPTFNPDTFDMENNSPKDIINTMCVSELVHLINVPISFVPVAACFFVPRLKEDLPIFIVTGILAAAFDMVFVIMQRYNRPRIVKLLKRQSRGTV